MFYMRQLSMGPHHGPAQNSGRRLWEFGNRLRCHLWLTIHNRHGQPFARRRRVHSARPSNTLLTMPNVSSIGSAVFA